MKNKFIRVFTSLVSVMLIAAVSLSLASCGDNKTTPAASSEAASVAASEEAAPAESTVDDGTEHVGEGETQFLFTAVMLDGTEKKYTVSTDATTVGAALVAVDLISGADSAYGLYVDTVCGEKHLFEEDGKYWALYINGEYAMTGVDATDIEAGASYTFKAE